MPTSGEGSRPSWLVLFNLTYGDFVCFPPKTRMTPTESSLANSFKRFALSVSSKHVRSCNVSDRQPSSIASPPGRRTHTNACTYVPTSGSFVFRAVCFFIYDRDKNGYVAQDELQFFISALHGGKIAGNTQRKCACLVFLLRMMASASPYCALLGCLLLAQCIREMYQWLS